VIPNKVKIGGFTWTTEFNEHLMHTREERGCTQPKFQRIEIDPGTQKQAQQETFIHELLEAIKWQYDITIEHKDLWNLSVVLHQVITDNPGIFDFKEGESNG
jgi:hypothetical protein